MPEDPQPKANPIVGGFSTDFSIRPGGKADSQYDKGSPYDQLPDLNAVRARNQGFWDGLANTGVNLFTTILGQGMSAVGSLVDPIFNWMGDADLKVNQGITGAGLDLQQLGQNQFPTYYDPKSGFGMDYVMSNIPSLASALSMLIPGYGIARGAGAVARMARLGALGESIISTGTGAIAMRHAENWMEAASLYDQIKNEGNQGLNPLYDKLSYEQIENAAKVGAATTYKMNWANLAFDVMQLAAVLKPIKGLTGWTNTLGKESKFAQVMDYGYKAALEKGILSDASKLTNMGLRSAAFMRPLLIQTTEGIEEANNYIAEQEGRRAAAIQAGMPDDGKSVFDRIPEYLQQRQLWDSFGWGIAGGVTFQKGGEALNRAGAKAGWWEDSTPRAQMLADMKNRSDIITRGYKDLSDPKLTEYDKEAVKANMLFDLVASNKSAESLDMLQEDLQNPAMLKKFGEMMGLNEADVQKEVPILLKDIEYINDKLDQYTGATLKSWAGEKTERISTGLDMPGEQTTTAAAVGPTRAAKLFNKVPFVNDPKIAMLLANNDYRVHVQERLNQKAGQEMQTILAQSFANKEGMDANAQAVFNTMAEIAALESIIKTEKEDLKSREEKKLPENYIDTAKKRVTNTEVALGRKKKQLQQLETIMNQLKSDSIPTTGFKEAAEYAVSMLGKGGGASKYASLKHMYYLNQLDKDEQLAVNREVLTDPAKFIENSSQAFKADQIFKQQQAEEVIRQEEEKKVIDRAIADLEADTNTEFQKATQKHSEGLQTVMANYDTSESKVSYLNKELEAVNKELETAASAGEFARNSFEEFNGKFNKKLYQELKARKAALEGALAPYKAKPASPSGAPKTSAAKATGVNKGPSIVKDQFEDGTPGKYYQGMVKMFGTDGKSGSFNNTFLSNKTGVAGLLQVFDTYPDFIKGLQDILENYQRAKTAADPNAGDILNEANKFAQTGRDFTAMRTETEKVAEIQQELEYLGEKWAKSESQTKLIPSESTAWKGIREGSYPDIYPDTYAFAKNLIDTYANIIDIDSNIDTIHSAIQNELQVAKDAFDQWQSGTFVPSKQEGPVEETNLEDAMDQTEQSASAIAEYPETEAFTESDILYPATHAESVVEIKDTDNGWQQTYVNGKARANPNFGMGNTIFIGKGNKVQPGFVSRGKSVVFTFTGEYRGKNENAEKEIRITDDQGNLIGYMDTANRLKKVIATLKNKKPKTQKKKDKIARTIAKYNELIPYYSIVRSQMPNKGDMITARVADNVSKIEGGVNSGGITIGSVITTSQDKNGNNEPIRLNSAFDITTINRKNTEAVSPVLLAVYYNGEFSTHSDAEGKFKDVTQVYPGVSIPTTARSVPTLSGKGTNNGAVFAVVPTNTFDQEGNRIHLPFKLATQFVVNINLTSLPTRQTLPEAMLDVLTNPDTRRSEFEMLAGRVNIKFKKEYPVTATENRDALLSLFTTENLLSIFNTVTYVYDGKQESKSQLKQRDYSHHIGIDVFNPKAAQDKKLNRPTIRFDISNDTGTKNTFAINLFDDQGMFKPTFGQKKVTAAQVMNAEQREAQPGLSQVETVVDVRESINKRFRQKLFRIDKKLLSRNSDKRPYKGIIFREGKLVEKEYQSYLHFLDEEGILESTIHGVSFTARDPKTGNSETGKTYFTSQSFWFDMDAPANEQVEKEPVSANNTYTGNPPIEPERPDSFLTFLRDVKSMKDLKKWNGAEKYIEQYVGPLKSITVQDVSRFAQEQIDSRSGKKPAAVAADLTAVQLLLGLIDQGKAKAYKAFVTNEETAAMASKEIAEQAQLGNYDNLVSQGYSKEFLDAAIKEYPTAFTGGFIVHPAINQSIQDRLNGKIERKGKGVNSYYEINGERYERVSHILKPAKDINTPATAAGNILDNAVKAALLGESPDREGFSEDSYQTVVDAMQDVERFLASKGQKVVNVDVVVYGKIKGGDGVVRNIAGEIDLLVVDQKGFLYPYDFKTSKKPFDLTSYMATDPKTGINRYNENQEQLTAYSLLLQEMTGNMTAGIGIIPFTIDYSTEGKEVVINTVVPYDPILFTNFAQPRYSVYGDTEIGTPWGPTVYRYDKNGNSRFDDNGNLKPTEDLTDEEIEGLNLDGAAPLNLTLWQSDEPVNMAASNQPASPYSDPSRFRDHSRPYPEQKQYEDYTAQMMLDVLYQHRVEKGNYSQLTYGDILERVKESIDAKIKTYQKIIKFGGIFTPTKQIRFSGDQVNEKQVQLQHFEQLRSLLESTEMNKAQRVETRDFVGYGRMGIVKLTGTGLIRTDIIEEDVNVKGPEELPYSVRFQENYAFKINPKTTINTEAKIFLSRIPEMERTNTTNGLEFRTVANLFGMNRYYNTDAVISELHIEFENIPPERFMDRLGELDTRIPIIRSVVQTINTITEKGNPERANQVRNQLSTLIKQRRDMKYLKAEIDEETGKVKATIIDAARQGISQNIIQTWEDNFRQEFRNLFDVEEQDPGNTRNSVLKAIPKKQVIKYSNTVKVSEELNLELPDDFNPDIHKISWQTEWLYNKLIGLSQATRVNLTFENGRLKVGKQLLSLSQSDVSQLILAAGTDNIVLNPKAELFSNDRYIKPTILEQISANVAYFLKKPGVYSGNTEDRKDKSGYYPIYYRIMADQLQRIGIQLSEDSASSWTILQDLNTPMDKSGQRRRFHMYDPRSESFEAFLNDKIGNLIIAPLLKQNAFATTEKQYMTEDNSDFGDEGKKIDAENPFSHSLQGINPLAKHSRLEWYSYANETIRNTNGDLEYTYTSANGLSTMLSKLKDPQGSYLRQVAETPMGRHNVFIRNLLNSPTALEDFTLHYVDGGKVNNLIKLLPEDANAGRANMLLWNLYYNNETKTAQRNKGGYMTTHSDSSVMPVMMFDKQILNVDFLESIDELGNRGYVLKLNELMPDQSENQIYRHLLGIFRGELQRIYEGYEVWKDIQAQPEESRLQYALDNYQLNLHYRIKNGKVTRGNAINMYLFGNGMFQDNTSGIYQDDTKSSLRKTFFDSQGNANEAAIKEHFDKFINQYINDLVDDAYRDTIAMGKSFFEIVEKQSQGVSKEDTKTGRLELKFKTLNESSVSALKSLFTRNAYVVTEAGRDNVETRNNRIEKTYTEKSLLKQGMTEAEARERIATANRTREDDIKAATYAELQLRYMVADMALNHAVFFGSLFQTMFDPSILEEGSNYQRFKDFFEKRMKGPISPGEVSYFKDNEPVKVVGFKDIRLGHIKVTLDMDKLSPIQTEFVQKFKTKMNIQGDLVPARIFDLMAFYYSRPEGQREKAWDDIRTTLEAKITDGGSYISKREWLYRLYRRGQITKADYKRAMDGGNTLPAKVMKFVYGGNNVVDTGSSSTNVYNYIKHAEIPLLPGVHEGTVLDELRKQIEQIEAREYAGITNGEPTPGIVAVPESSFKTGFNFNAEIIAEDGSITDQLPKTKVLNLNRGWLREQIQSPDDQDKRSMISSQANVLTDLDIPADYRFGQRGPITFSSMQEGDKQTEVNEEGEEVPVEESGTGISSNVLQNSVVQIFTEIAERRFTDKIHQLGLNRQESEYMVTSVGSFIRQIKEQALSRFGVGANAIDYLTVLREGDDQVLSIPLSFTPAARRLQSVFLAELKDMFYRFTLPGGAFSQFSAAGLHTFEKGKIKVDSDLKSYRIRIVKSRPYGSEEEAMKNFTRDEIHSPYNPSTKTLEYYEVDPGDAVLPWIFKDENGKLLDYDTYVNKDGTPKDNIDPKLLDFVAFRIPNTGPNASARLRAKKFMRPEMGDGIAVAPEIIAILGADFDYDKLYSYIYNYKIVRGKLVKIDSVLHGSQNGQEDFFVSDNQKREFAKRKLFQTNPEYRTLVNDQQAVQKGIIDLERDYNDMVSALGKMNWEDFVRLREKITTLDPEAIAKSMRLQEDEYMKSEEFEKAYSEAGIYQKQSLPALENALIDRFNLMLGDFKMLKYMTSPLTSDWLSEQVNDKLVPYYDGDTVKTSSIVDQLYDKKFHSITSYNSFLQSRLSNTSAGSLIGMGANSLIAQYQGQRWNLSLNDAAYADEFQDAYILRFKDRSGKIKGEQEADRHNSSFAGKYSPYTVRRRGETLYTPPTEGRWRLDRITTINDKGEEIYVSTALKAVLQAALDHQKNPLIDKGYINPLTFNAAGALIRLGYVDEVIPLLNQESVFNYVQGISGYYGLEANEGRISVLLRIVGEYSGQYGINEDQVLAIYRSLPKEHKNGALVINRVLRAIAQVENGNDILTTKDLLFGIAQRAGSAPIDGHYGIRQLAALRDFLIADIYGRQLFNIQQGTSAYAKGLKSSFAEVDLQDRRFNSLFKYSPRANAIESTAPLIAGLHRINYAWSKAMGRPGDFRPTMMSYGQFRGVRPSLQLLHSVEGNVFTEFTSIFRGVRRAYFLTSTGTDINHSLEGVSNNEFTRVFNKMNTNLVSFYFSNPELYRALFTNPQEYDLFTQYGMQLLTRPQKDLPYDPGFSMFNKAESLAKQIERISKMTNPVTGNEYGIDYDVLTALKPIFNVSFKTPSSVIYMNASGYQENQNHRLAMSIAEMYRSSDPELSSLARKLIIYAFMTGGVTTPTSFVQFLPPSLLRDIGFDKTLRKSLEVSQRKELINDTIKSFMVQYFQHHPFELGRQLNAKQLVYIDGSVVQYDKALGRNVIQINPEEKEWFKNKYIFRLDNKLYVHHPTDNNYLMEIDNLGMNKWHRNEYNFNFARVPGESLYAHNISEGSRIVTEGIEVRGDFTADEVHGNPEVDRLIKKLETPMFDKIVDKPTSLPEVIEAVQIDKTNPTAASVLTFLKPLVSNATVTYEPMAEIVMGFHKAGTRNIAVNPLHRLLKGISTGNPQDFNSSRFAELIAHESTHMATAVSIESVLNGSEKDPAKVQAVKRLQELQKRSIEIMSKDPALKEKYSTYLRFMELSDKAMAGKKLAAAEVKFLRENNRLGGFYTMSTGETPQQMEVRRVHEFVAYAFSNEGFQQDLNNIDLRKGQSFWQELLQAIFKLLGLNISEQEAQEELTDIKKKLTPRQPILNASGVPDTKRNQISDTLRDLQPFSALHVALREIIQLGAIAKTEALNASAFAAIAGQKLNLAEVYDGVSNFNPEWSEEMKKLYHSAALNQNIVC